MESRIDARASRLGSRRPWAFVRSVSLAATVTIVLSGSPLGIRDASAGSSEDRLLSITKTTVYGGLLGGLLGLAAALVAREGYRDDAIRWGVALGTFGGFAYGFFYTEKEDVEGLSLWNLRGPQESRASGSPAITGPARNVAFDPSRSFNLASLPEVSHALPGLKEEPPQQALRFPLAEGIGP